MIEKTIWLIVNYPELSGVLVSVLLAYILPPNLAKLFSPKTLIDIVHKIANTPTGLRFK